ncbi:hypothetical protein M422DRAFT_76759 [Sphaerobolus stellatus SS14]|uniref:Phospholipid-transporting ATPase n=1 Tax=Sphaerobolus stellatus (strain SS14) TaxID=990650 RepID=A0A0C9UW55_SPHS4|nr:hypothetical protein M422DRAFT_76759 [Sphaerobolus stellatus SS14]
MVQSWYRRLNDWNVESLFGKAPRPKSQRSIYVNEDLPADYFDQKGRPKKEHVYSTNQVITSKYTVITFLPRNLLEQFRRVVNITISPGLVVLPLIIVLAVTVTKDGYDDIKRHQGDRVVNHSETRVLNGGGWDNPNRTGKKSKTFVKGLLPSRHKLSRKELESNAEESINENQIEYDTEDERHGHRVSGTCQNSFHLNQSRNIAHWKRTLWEDVKAGDFVKIQNDEPIPADILICATSEEENAAFIETKNLDGETNLKSRNAVPALTYLRTAHACASSPGFNINCEAPDIHMYKLNAAVVWKTDSHPIDIQTTLLRGTVLLNTQWVIGIVLFTGADAKIILNSGNAPSKCSRIERQMNPQVFVNLALLIIMAAVCGIVDASLEQRNYPAQAPWLYDDNRSDDNPKINGLITLVNGLITFQNIIPISLILSIEFVRSYQGAFIYFDSQMYYEKTALAFNSNLLDDLGQIEYVFSDKTGTLTQNAMAFRECSIAGRLYKGDPLEDTPKEGMVPEAKAEDKSLGGPSRSSDSDTVTSPVETTPPDPEIVSKVKLSSGVVSQFRDAELSAFFSVLGLCHTVLATIDPETQAIEYKAQSPDEAALVQAAADVGFIFRGREREILRLQTPFESALEEWELLNSLDFNSVRKRMSDKVYLLTKGADNIIFDRLRKDGDPELSSTTERHLDEFASDGLRTLWIAYKIIPMDVYQEWAARYHDATVALRDREEKIDQVSSEIEKNLHLLGATSIEDKLQDGVPETIADLKCAGIKVWVLTGDKLETAIDQILEAVGQFFPESDIIQKVCEKGFQVTIPEKIERPDLTRNPTGLLELVGNDNGDRPGRYILVVDRVALGNALHDPFNKELLLQLAVKCEAAICCRVSPLQKALVVRLVKDGLKCMTLAIGDGANDVSMIQAADVGVGIRGEGGLQAVNSSDYAIAQFRFLKRLILVHGHWSYARNGTVIINFFYKNIIWIGVLWWFQIYCAWSTQYVFEYTYLVFWNVLWTLYPVTAIVLFDRFLDANILMAIPELYHYGRERTWFGLRLFSVYMFEGIIQSTIIFFFINYAYNETTVRSNGYQGYIYEFSTVIWIWFAVWFRIVLVWGYTAIYSLISPSTAVYDILVLCCFPFCLALLPRYLYKAIQRQYFPTDIDILREIQLKTPGTDFAKHPQLGGLHALPAEPAEPRASISTTASSQLHHFPMRVLSQDRNSMEIAGRSVTDMSLGGIQSQPRGFGFFTEEGGVQIQRIQSNLSEGRVRDMESGRHKKLFP